MKVVFASIVAAVAAFTPGLVPLAVKPAVTPYRAENVEMSELGLH